MDKIYEQTMLFEFYGELLTAHQRSIYEDALYNDFSLGEIAEERGITRQGVHDLIKRCDRILQDYESKLHLVERFSRTKRTLEEIEELTLMGEAPPGRDRPEGACGQAAGPEKMREYLAEMRERLEAIRRLSHELSDEL